MGVRVQKNKMGPFSGTFQEWNKKAREGAVSFCHYSERQLTLRVLMSYIYMEHLFLMFLDHTQRRSTVGRTPLDE